ncbi:metallophosphoesterase [Streptomyces sp. NPDC058001]|uniref:metallophosphoesterase n=1 Tax=Streptomyces sp. NPDC058001 TaxID=3346300 RepID=UPI0036E73403
MGIVVGILIGLIAFAVLGGLQWYVWRRVVRDTTTRGTGARRAGTAVFVVGPLLMVGALVSGRTAPFWLQKLLAWPGYLWMALSMYLLLSLLVGELVRPVLRRALARRDRGQGRDQGVGEPDEARAEVTVGVCAGVGATSGADPAPGTPAPGAQTPDAAAPGTPVAADAPSKAPERPGPSRRVFVSRVVAGAAVVAAAGTVGYGSYGVLRGPSVKRVTVPLAKLPRSTHGFRIAVVSDIHLGPILGRSFSQRVVDTINSTRPDLIAVVGDLVDGSVANLGPAAAPLAGLEARHGAFFVTGNHEYFSGAEEWVDEVRSLGLHPLENARTELPGFDLAGVNDVSAESEGQGPDYAKALGDRDPARASVLLAHQPVMIHDAVRHGVDLQLSGHTHGGQLWPGSLIAELANPTVAGLERYGDTQLYVTRGAGAWGPPVRVGAPSDITVVELASKQA